MCNEMLSSSKNGESRGLQQPGTVPILLLNTSPHSQPLWPLSNEGSLGRDGLNWYYKLSTNEFCSAGLDKLWGWLATMFSICRLVACKRHYCDKKQCISIFRISGSLWLSLALFLLYLWLTVTVTVTLAHSDAPGFSRLTLGVPLALPGAHQLTRSLLGSLRCNCVAQVYHCWCSAFQLLEYQMGGRRL